MFKSSSKPSILAFPMLPRSRKERRYRSASMGIRRRSILRRTFFSSMLLKSISGSESEVGEEVPCRGWWGSSSSIFSMPEGSIVASVRDILGCCEMVVGNSRFISRRKRFCPAYTALWVLNKLSNDISWAFCECKEAVSWVNIYLKAKKIISHGQGS